VKEKILWKQKIDPAFPKLIETYLEFISISQISGNKGYICPAERQLENLKIENYPSIASVYEHDDLEEGFVELGLLLGEESIENDMKSIKRELKKKKNIFAWYLEMSEHMENESKKYYSEAFEPFSSTERFQEYISGKDKAACQIIGRKMKSDIYTFIFHHMTVPFIDDKEEIKRNIQFKNIRLSTKMTKRTLFSVWDSISLLVNGASLKELFKKAKSGDDDALYDLIKVDKTLFAHEWVRERINKAAYIGDGNFFELLGKAVADDPLKHSGRKEDLDKLFLVIKFFWDFGLYRLSDYELHDLLLESKIDIYENVESFSKHLSRHRNFLPK